jgi:hypothetical protein
MLALFAAPSVGAAATYVISVPGVIETTSGTPSNRLAVGDAITINTTFDDRYVFDWGSNGYKVLATWPTCFAPVSCPAGLPTTPLQTFTINTGTTSWGVFRDSCSGQCGFVVRENLGLSPFGTLLVGGPAIAFTDTQVLSVFNGLLLGLDAGLMPRLSFGGPFQTATINYPGQPDFFPPVPISDSFSLFATYQANTANCPGNVGCTTTWTGHWNLAAATVQVLSVPEPGTWLTMILGFGGIGLVLRRRRQMLMGSSL